MNLSAKAKLSRRQNARKSTGPKSLAGKMRVARNALSHGLSIPFGSLPGSDEPIEQLAKVLLSSIGISDEGLYYDRAISTAARQFAEAQLDLERIRLIRMSSLKANIIKIETPTSKQLGRLLELSERVRYDEKALREAERLAQLKINVINPAIPQKYKMMSPLLHRIDRYERRALSKRRKALQLLTELNTTYAPQMVDHDEKPQ